MSFLAFCLKNFFAITGQRYLQVIYTESKKSYTLRHWIDNLDVSFRRFGTSSERLPFPEEFSFEIADNNNDDNDYQS